MSKVFEYQDGRIDLEGPGPYEDYMTQDGRIGLVGVVFDYTHLPPIGSGRNWIIVKYDVHNRENVYIAPFMPTEEYISNPADDDHLVYGGYNGSRVFLLNRAVFVPVARIGHCEVIQRDYSDARKLQQHLSDLVTGMVCEVKESAPPRLRGGSVLKDEEGDKP